MCESTVFLNEKGNLKEIMRDVTKIYAQENKIVCVGLLGEREEIKGVQIVEANLMEHRIVLGKVKRTRK